MSGVRPQTIETSSACRKLELEHDRDREASEIQFRFLIQVQTGESRQVENLERVEIPHVAAYANVRTEERHRSAAKVVARLILIVAASFK